jgi:hypothetical protein
MLEFIPSGSNISFANKKTKNRGMDNSTRKRKQPTEMTYASTYTTQLYHSLHHWHEKEHEEGYALFSIADLCRMLMEFLQPQRYMVLPLFDRHRYADLYQTRHVQWLQDVDPTMTDSKWRRDWPIHSSFKISELDLACYRDWPIHSSFKISELDLACQTRHCSTCIRLIVNGEMLPIVQVDGYVMQPPGKNIYRQETCVIRMDEPHAMQQWARIQQYFQDIFVPMANRVLQAAHDASIPTDSRVGAPPQSTLEPLFYHSNAASQSYHIRLSLLNPNPWLVVRPAGGDKPLSANSTQTLYTECRPSDVHPGDRITAFIRFPTVVLMRFRDTWQLHVKREALQLVLHDLPVSS